MDLTTQPRQRLVATIRGKVQGVSFRYFTQQQARELGLTGWVRNLSNGQVSTIAEGETDKLTSFLEALQIGPPMAKVTGVHHHFEDATGEFDQFRIRHF